MADFLGTLVISLAFVLLLMAWVIILATPLKGKSRIKQAGIVAAKVLVVSFVVEWAYLAFEINKFMQGAK